MINDKVGSAVIIGVVTIICIAVSAGATYFVVEHVKQDEINNITSQFEMEKSELNQQVLALQGLDTDYHKYVKQMVNGLTEFALARGNSGYGESDYDDAGLNYDENYFEVAETYADSADIFYGYASTGYRDAKAFFNTALKYASSNSTKQLAQLYVNLSEVEAQLASEMHEANEYFSSACNCYINGWWELGDTEIERMNEHIEEHDNLIPTQNDLWSSIDALLEDFT